MVDISSQSILSILEMLTSPEEKSRWSSFCHPQGLFVYFAIPRVWVFVWWAPWAELKWKWRNGKRGFEGATGEERETKDGWERNLGRHRWSLCEPPSWSSWETFSKICISLKQKKKVPTSCWYITELDFFVGGIHSSNKYLIESLIHQEVF